jgi:hypothetical protein
MIRNINGEKRSKSDSFGVLSLWVVGICVTAVLLVRYSLQLLWLSPFTVWPHLPLYEGILGNEATD